MRDPRGEMCFARVVAIGEEEGVDCLQRVRGRAEYDYAHEHEGEDRGRRDNGSV